MRNYARSTVYHVAPRHRLAAILSDGYLASPSFLSFSERPLTQFKTRSGGVIFAFDQGVLQPLLLRVDYRDPEGFLASYPEHGAYVAHYADPGSFEVPPRTYLSLYGEHDFDWSVFGPKVQEFFAVARQLAAFSSEGEWVTRRRGQRIPVRPPYLTAVYVLPKGDLPTVRRMAEAAGISVPVEAWVPPRPSAR